MRSRIYICSIILLFACGSHSFGQWRGGQVYRLTLPNKNWSLDVSLADFVVLSEELADDGRIYRLHAAHKKYRQSPMRFVQLKVRMEPAQIKGSDIDFRSYAIKFLTENEMAKKDSIKTSEYNHIPVISYKIAGTVSESPAGDMSFTFKTAALNAFLVKDDVWITVELLASSSNESDEQMFHSVLDSLKLTDISSPTSSYDYYQRGRALFIQKQYSKAAEAFATALKLEQQKRQLSDAQWRYLLEDLANSYGAIGDRSRAQEVLSYGVSNDPTYPYFHLGLARIHALSDDMDAALASLEKAFLAVKNNAQDEHLPDPLTDPAFARFKKEDKFRKAVKAMKK
jgi:tetratricopeptide (TPR) repeat protein